MDTPLDQWLLELTKRAAKVLNGSSRPLPEGWQDAARQDGCLVLKEALVDGAYYLGYCRNARMARWDAQGQRFVHWRTKFGSRFTESIKHPEDDNGFDLFVPLLQVPSGNKPTEQEEISDDQLRNAY